MQKLQKAVVKEVSQAVRATQEAGADVLQLGMQVEWNNPGEWKRLKERWEDYYSHDAQIKVSADIKIQDIGSVK
ncbi:Spore germination protein A3 precursor [compost metagenome]